MLLLWVFFYCWHHNTPCQFKLGLLSLEWIGCWAKPQKSAKSRKFWSLFIFWGEVLFGFSVNQLKKMTATVVKTNPVVFNSHCTFLGSLDHVALNTNSNCLWNAQGTKVSSAFATVESVFYCWHHNTPCLFKLCLNVIEVNMLLS